jgi:GNAT superfamily N-acetyltransferase
MVEWQRDDGSIISTDPGRLDIDLVHRELATSYWAADVARETVERSIAGSIVFGVYDGQRQVGFARVVTDRATFAWVCDVFVVEPYRGRRLGVWLMECVVAHPELQGLRRWLLATRDAHDLYRKVGFEALPEPDRFMIRRGDPGHGSRSQETAAR